MGMDGTGSDIEDRTTRFSLGLAIVFGERAKLLADQQAATALAETTALSWRRIGATLRVMEDASAHMERALALLDSIAELTATPYLHQAIAKLSMRRPPERENAGGRPSSDRG